MGLGSDLVDLYGGAVVGLGQAGNDLVDDFLAKPGSPWTPGQSDGAPGWPERVDMGGHSYRTIQPGKLYVEGEAVAVSWPNGGQPDRATLIARAAKLGQPWWNPGWTGIGAKLEKKYTGSQIINTLTCGKWQGTIPVMLPAEMVAMGLLLAQGSSAVDAMGNAIFGGASALGALGKVNAGLVTALPWILVAGGVAVVGYVTWKVLK